MIMIDIETLGLRPGAPIPSIGYCYFDWDGIRDHGTIAINLEVGNIGKAADIGTIKFWLRQDHAAIQKTFFRPEDQQHDWVRALYMLGEKVQFSRTIGEEGVWANGPLFDLAHLEYWYDQMSEKAPWSYREPRDCRTLFEIARLLTGWDRSVVTQALKDQHPALLVEHDAEHDAILQALLVIDAYHACKRRADTSVSLTG